jgi:hypothetical protein
MFHALIRNPLSLVFLNNAIFTIFIDKFRIELRDASIVFITDIYFIASAKSVSIFLAE